MAEVERGKTTINNMDLLDSWKCHIYQDASYLPWCCPVSYEEPDDVSP